MDRSVILKYLLDGELDRLLSQPNAKMSEFMNKVIESYETLSGQLSDEHLTILDEYKERLDAHHAEEILHTITESFLAGMNFALALKKN
jgi:hypothetical protein